MLKHNRNKTSQVIAKFFNTDLWIETPKANKQWSCIMNSIIRHFAWIYHGRSCGDILHRKSIKNLQMFSQKVSTHSAITSISCASDHRGFSFQWLEWLSGPVHKGRKKNWKCVAIQNQFLNCTFTSGVKKWKGWFVREILVQWRSMSGWGTGVMYGDVQNIMGNGNIEPLPCEQKLWVIDRHHWKHHIPATIFLHLLDHWS